MLVDIDERRHDEDEDDQVDDFRHDERVVVQPFRQDILPVEKFKRAHQTDHAKDTQEDHVLREEGNEQRGCDGQIGKVGDAQEEPRLVALDVETRRKVKRDDDCDENVDHDPCAIRQPLFTTPGNRWMKEEQDD